METAIPSLARLFAALVLFSAPVIAAENEIDTGIVVTAKTYDERAIQQLINRIDSRLEQLSFIQKESLQASVGNLAGGNRNSSSVNFGLNTAPTAGIVSTLAAPEAGGDPVLSTVTTESSITSPVPVAARDALTFSAPSVFGLAGRSLLSEQLELSYRVAGLRLGLERAIEDHADLRFNGSEGDEELVLTGVGVRRLALIGVDISIDEQVISKDAAAEVRIMITTDGGENFCPGFEPTLLQLLPQRESYNTVSVTDKKSQIGFGLLAGIIQLGLETGKNSERLYIIQELDTVSYRFATDNSQTLSVGWRFRPPIGQTKVLPGLRKTFILVTLPDSGHKSKDTDCTLPNYVVKAETAWLDWDSSDRSVGKVIRKKRQVLKSDSKDIRTISYQRDIFRNGFNPYITSIEWQETNNETISVVASGLSFFSDLELIIGGNRLTVNNGLRLHNAERISFEVPLSTVFDAPQGLVVGRYTSTGRNYFAIDNGRYCSYPPSVSAQVTARDAKTAELTLLLVNYPNVYASDFGNVPNRSMIRVGKNIYGGQKRPAILRTSSTEQVKPEPKKSCGAQELKDEITKTEIKFLIPIKELVDARGIHVVEPFHSSSAYSKHISLAEIRGLFAAEASGMVTAPSALCDGKEQKCTAFAVIGQPAKGSAVSAKIGATKLTPLTDYSNTERRRYFSVPNSLIDETSPMVITAGYADPWFIPLKTKKVVPSPKITEAENVDQNDERWVVLQGSDLSSIDSVLLGERVLPTARAGKTKLRVFLDRKITEKPGVKELALIHSENKRIYAKVTVIAKGA